MCILCETWKAETGEGWNLNLLDDGAIEVKASPEEVPSVVTLDEDPESLYGRLTFLLMMY